MTEMQVIGLLGALAALGIAALTVWRYIQSQIHVAMATAADKASTAGALAALTQNMLNEHKLHVAETYVTKAGLREFRDEVMGGIKELKGSVSTIHDRIDQMILADHPPKSRRE